MARKYTKVEHLAGIVKERKAEERANNEIVQLRMQVELLRNFLLEAGRR